MQIHLAFNEISVVFMCILPRKASNQDFHSLQIPFYGSPCLECQHLPLSWSLNRSAGLCLIKPAVFSLASCLALEPSTFIRAGYRKFSWPWVPCVGFPTSVYQTLFCNENVTMLGLENPWMHRHIPEGVQSDNRAAWLTHLWLVFPMIIR